MSFCFYSEFFNTKMTQNNGHIMLLIQARTPDFAPPPTSPQIALIFFKVYLNAWKLLKMQTLC